MARKHRDNKCNALHDYIKVALSSSGFRKGDYDLKESSLYFKIKQDRVKKDKISSTLSQAFPQYSFVWESAHKLIWF